MEDHDSSSSGSLQTRYARAESTPAVEPNPNPLLEAMLPLPQFTLKQKRSSTSNPTPVNPNSASPLLEAMLFHQFTPKGKRSSISEPSPVPVNPNSVSTVSEKRKRLVKSRSSQPVTFSDVEESVQRYMFASSSLHGLAEYTNKLVREADMIVNEESKLEISKKIAKNQEDLQNLPDMIKKLEIESRNLMTKLFSGTTEDNKPFFDGKECRITSLTAMHTAYYMKRWFGKEHDKVWFITGAFKASEYKEIKRIAAVEGIRLVDDNSFLLID